MIYVWKMSGLDARSHAFRSDGGFVPSVNLYVAELGVVEFRVPMCGEILPTAFVMPHCPAPPCARCAELVELPTEIPRSPQVWTLPPSFVPE